MVSNYSRMGKANLLDSTNVRGSNSYKKHLVKFLGVDADPASRISVQNVHIRLKRNRIDVVIFSR